MSEAAVEAEGAEGGGGGKGKLILIIVIVLVLVGGGGGGYFFFLRGGGEEDSAKAEKSEKKSKKKKKSSKKDSADEEDSSESGPADESLREALQDDENVKHVVELDPFIVNLADVEEARYLRMTVSLGIGESEEGGEEAPDPIFLAKVKNAMLAVLSVKKSEDVLTVEGKAKLRKQLLEAAQSASEDGHVEAIYITDFIVQL